MASRKRRKDKQRSTKHTYKTKDRVTRTPLKTGGKLRCPGRESSSCSTSGSSIYVPSRLYLWGIVTGYDVNGNDVTGSDRKLHHLNSWTRIGNEREIISRGFFSPGFSRGFSGTSLDSRYGQWNCESNNGIVYRVTIALLLPMLNYFPPELCSQPWLMAPVVSVCF